MGFGDKLKGLREQAQQAVAEHKEEIQTAVQTVGVAANEKTHGKYATKIMRVGEKVSAKVEQVGSTDPGAGNADPSSVEHAPTAEASFADENVAAAPAAEASFADEPAVETSLADEPAAEAPASPSGTIPDFE